MQTVVADERLLASVFRSDADQSVSDRGTGGNPALRMGEKSFTIGPRQNARVKSYSPGRLQTN